MTGKIFINYRRDDVPGDARGIRDGLAAKFGKSAVFMDVDNLLAGQRFDRELAKALDQCSALIAVIGPRWMELLNSRADGSDRDYVREEIAAALKRDIPVIPVRVGREGALSPLPRADQLPEDIRELVLHQKHDVSQERFGRDVADLVREIGLVRRGARAPAPWGKIAGGIVGTVALGAVVFFWPQVSNFFKSNPAATQVAFPATQAPPVTPPAVTPPGSTAADSAAEEEKRKVEADKRRAEEDKKRTADAEAKRRSDEKSAAEKVVADAADRAEAEQRQLAKEQEQSANSSSSTSIVESRLQKVTLWQILKRDFPDWYSEQISAAEKLSPNEYSKNVVARSLVKGLVALRRQNADKALAASPEKLRQIALAFLAHLKAMRAMSSSACYGYISKGEESPVAVEIMETPESATTLNAEMISIVEAIRDGSNNRVARTDPIKSDFEIVIKELSKLGWKDHDLQVFSDPKLLAKQEPEQVCQMVQDWFSAHLAVTDKAVQDRLLFATLKPVLKG